MRLNNVVIAARDYAAMKEFYVKLTDWPIFFEKGEVCFLGRGKPYVVIHAPTDETEVTPPESTMCLDFETNDLEAEVDRLEREGLVVEWRNEMAVIRDPAGNLIEIVPSE